MKWLFIFFKSDFFLIFVHCIYLLTVNVQNQFNNITMIRISRNLFSWLIFTQFSLFVSFLAIASSLSTVSCCGETSRPGTKDDLSRTISLTYVHAYKRIRQWLTSRKRIVALVNESSRTEIKWIVSKIWTDAPISYSSTRETAVQILKAIRYFATIHIYERSAINIRDWSMYVCA